MKRRTEITVETERLLLVKARRPVVAAWCVACGARTAMVNPAEAARLLGVTTRDIYRRLEGGELHFTEATGDELFICSRSL